MASIRVSVRVDEKLHQLLEKQATADREHRSGVVRKALKAYLTNNARHANCYEVAQQAGIIGAVKNAPSDWSTHRRHFRGFGK